eukprot:1391991-Amorphochlora_amoeboformis.AAC.2
MVYTNSQGSCVDHMVRRFRIVLINRPKSVGVGIIVLLTMLFYTATNTPVVPSSTSTRIDVSVPSIPKPPIANKGLARSNGGGNIYDDRFDAVTRDERYKSVGMKGATLWFTGFSGSGKSTIGKELEKVLIKEYRKHAYRLDGDNLRFGLNNDLGFSKEDRNENVRRVGEVAKLFAASGVIVVASLISPYRASRDQVRKIHEEVGLQFIEVFVDVPIDAAAKRDPKGLYKKAKEGKLKGFTGIDAPYEAPLNPEIRLPSHQMTLEEEVRVLVQFLASRGILTATENTPTWYPALIPPDGGMHWEPPSFSVYTEAQAMLFPQ